MDQGPSSSVSAALEPVGAPHRRGRLAGAPIVASARVLWYGRRPSAIWTPLGVECLYSPSTTGTSPAFPLVCWNVVERARNHSAEPDTPACPSIRDRQTHRGTEASMHRSRPFVLVILAAAAACSKHDSSQGNDILSQDRTPVA